MANPTPARPNPTRKVLWIGAAVILLMAGWGTLGWYLTGGFKMAHEMPSVGGPFELIGTDGQTVTDRDFAGKPRAMFFGFTYCPDVCPTTLADVGTWLKALGDKADDIRFIFVSIDPERDTPQLIKDYLSAFDPRITGLTGSVQQVDAIKRNYRVYAKKVPTEDGDYTMDHTAGVYLFDKNGTFAGTVDYTEPAETAVKKIEAVLN